MRKIIVNFIWKNRGLEINKGISIFFKKGKTLLCFSERMKEEILSSSKVFKNSDGINFIKFKEVKLFNLSRLNISFLKWYNCKWTSLEYDTSGPPGPPGGFLFIWKKFDFHYSIPPEKYINHLLPDPYVLKNGEKIYKPETW
jgi:hypothetical protein